MGRLEGDLGGLVAAEVGGVDVDAADHAGQGQADERPVVVLGGRVRLLGADTAATAGLPAVHDLALVAEGVRVELAGLGLEEVLAVGEELVVGRDDAAAQTPVGEVDQAREVELGVLVVGVGVTALVRLGVVGTRIEGLGPAHGSPVVSIGGTFLDCQEKPVNSSESL